MMRALTFLEKWKKSRQNLQKTATALDFSILIAREQRKAAIAHSELYLAT